MITFQDVSKSFGAQQVLRDVSFRIAPGEHVGIVGPNGAGKSTIFALIVEELTSDSGTITKPRDCKLGYLHQQYVIRGAADTLLEYAESGVPELAELEHHMHEMETALASGTLNATEKETALSSLGTAQTQFEDKGGYTLRNRAETALHGLGFLATDLARPIHEFSGGWQMRAELVRVLLADPDMLLLDEPSNYLDLPAIEWLQGYLRAFNGTLMLISHDRYLLNSLTTITLEIAHAEATRYDGNYDVYMHERVRRLEQRIAVRKNQDKKREQAERFIDRFRAKSTKAAAVQSRIKMLDRMATVEVPRDLASKGHFRLPAPERCGHEVVRLDDVGLTYDNERWVLRHIMLQVQRGTKTALVGLNGMGKTTLLRLVAGQLQPSEGKRVLGHHVTVGYQSQEFAETMPDNLSVYDTVRSVPSQASDQTVRTMLGGFGFTGDDASKSVQVLSGGEKVRLAFARMLINPPNLLLLDEPTTHLDIGAREVLEEALVQFAGTLLIVSHDTEFVRHVADSILAMTPPGITRYPGGYDYYREKIAAASTPVVATPSRKPSPRDDRRERAEVVQKYSKVRRELQKNMSRLEQKLEKGERERSEVLEALNQPGADYEALNRTLASTQQVINDITSQWEAFALELDELDQNYKAARQKQT